MDLPIQFPSETEVILEDAARFRALSPAERMRALQGLLRVGARLRRMSPNGAGTAEYVAEQENLAQRNILEFIARHER